MPIEHLLNADDSVIDHGQNLDSVLDFHVNEGVHWVSSVELLLGDFDLSELFLLVDGHPQLQDWRELLVPLVFVEPDLV